MFVCTRRRRVDRTEAKLANTVTSCFVLFIHSAVWLQREVWIPKCRSAHGPQFRQQIRVGWSLQVCKVSIYRITASRQSTSYHVTRSVRYA